MGPMAQKLADELIHPKPPGHVHVVLEIARRMVLQRLLEDGSAEVRPGYTLEYCGMTAVDLHGAILQAALDAAEGKKG